MGLHGGLSVVPLAVGPNGIRGMSFPGKVSEAAQTSTICWERRYVEHDQKSRFLLWSRYGPVGPTVPTSGLHGIDDQTSSCPLGKMHYASQKMHIKELGVVVHPVVPVSGRRR